MPLPQWWRLQLSSKTSHTVVVATYNVHRCIGRDGQQRPERVLDVLKSINADVIALQEVDASLPEHGIDQLAFLGRALNMQAVMGATLRSHRGMFGNGVLSRVPIVGHSEIDLSVDGREPRCALDVRLDVQGRPLRFVATHFGLGVSERRLQMRRLLSHLEQQLGPTILAGDLNEWLPTLSSLALARRAFRLEKSPKTFPAALPVLALDRILMHPAGALSACTTPKVVPTRVASDHLPLMASATVPLMTVLESQVVQPLQAIQVG